MAGEGIYLRDLTALVAAKLAHPGPKNLGANQGADAAHHMDGAGAGKIVEAHLGQPAAAPNPVRLNGVDQCRDHSRIDTVGQEFRSFRHGTGYDGSCSGTEHQVKHKVRPVKRRIAGKDINATASNGYLLLNDSVMNAKNNINLTSKDAITSAKLAGTTFTAGKDVNVTSTSDSILLTSTSQFKPTSLLNLNGAKNVEINAQDSLTTEKTTIKAGENVFLTSAKGDVNVKDSTKFLAAKKIYIQGANDVKTTGTVDMNNIQTNIIAGRNVDVNLANVGNRNNGLVAKAGQDMKVTTAGTLSVSSLISGKDMTINANKVIAGLPYTTEQKLPGDASERSYIEVGGEFTSNVANDNYVITQSGDRTDDGKYNQRHHIQYGSQEKILLVNKRPVDNKVTDPNMPGVDNGDDVDVINPGETPADPNPTPTPTPTPTPDPNPEPNPNPNPNPGDGEECPDTPNDDVIEDEDAPELLSTKDLLNYSAGTSKQRRI